MEHSTSYGFVWERGYHTAPVLINAARRIQQTGWFSSFTNDYWVFDYSISNYGRYKVGRHSRSWLPRPPRVGHLYPPGITYFEDLRKVSKPIEDIWVIFAGGENAGLPKLIPKGYSYARFFDPEGLCQALLQKTALIGKEEGDSGFWKAQSVFCEFIGLLDLSRPVGKQTYQIISGVQKPGHSAWLTSVQEYLQTQCARPVCLDDIAHHCNVSVSTLCHRYHAETGQSPINDHLKLRIELVKNLLLKGQRLKEIAEGTGFYDQYHLSKMFKQLTGLSPRQFIRSLTEDHVRCPAFGQMRQAKP